MKITYGSIAAEINFLCMMTIYMRILYVSRWGLLSGDIKPVFWTLDMMLIRFLLPVRFPFMHSIESRYIMPFMRSFAEMYLMAGKNKTDILIAMIWFGGALKQCITLVTVNYRFKKCIIPYRVKRPDLMPGLKEALELSGAEDMNVYVLPTLTSPSITGMWRPVLLLPEKQYSKEELEMICLHETAHIRNRDLYTGFLLNLMKCIQWFNPLVGILEKEYRIVSEISADQAVVRRLNKNGTLQYAGLLIGTAAAQKKTKQRFLKIGMNRSGVYLRVKYFLYAIENKHKSVMVIRDLVPVFLLILSFVCIPGNR